MLFLLVLCFFIVGLFDGKGRVRGGFIYLNLIKEFDGVWEKGCAFGRET